MPRTEKANHTVKRITLGAFHDWAREAQFNAELTYFVEGDGERNAAIFKYARKLQRAGLVCLFQRRERDGGKDLFAYIAKRSPVLAHVALDALSAAIHVPPSSDALAAQASQEKL